jgi:hypothetical protein
LTAASGRFEEGLSFAARRLRAVKNAADQDMIACDSVENNVLAVHELMCSAFIKPTHPRVFADQFEHIA